VSGAVRVALRIGVALGVVSEPRRAAPVRLDPDSTTSEAFLVITAECIDHWRANAPAVVATLDVEALHQTRVGIRRFRSCLSLFGRSLDEPQVRWLSDEIRELGLPLGVARDLDVFLESPEVAGLSAEQLTQLRERREEAHDDVVTVLTSTRWADAWALVERFRSHAPWSLDPDPPARDTAAAALERRWQRVHHGGGMLRELTPAERHAVRIEAKKLRYGGQFFTDLFPGAGGTPPQAFAEGVEALQETLGLLNDVHTHELLLESVGAPPVATDEEALLDDAVAAANGVRALEPFWHGDDEPDETGSAR
jgi:triphosphatase